MFLIIHRATVTSQTDDPAEALEFLAATRERQPEAYLTEVLVPGADPRTAIPGELDRAIDAWNLLCNRVHFPKIRNRAYWIKYYRKWTKEAAGRDYFLDQVVAMVEATRFCWPWIKFGKMMGHTKDGDLHSEMLMGEQWKHMKPMEDVSGMVIRKPEPPEPERSLTDKVRAVAPEVWRLLDHIGNPDSDAKSRKAFNLAATWIKEPDAESSFDRWQRWKTVCAETGVSVRFSGIGGANV